MYIYAGPMFVYGMGSIQFFCITDAEMVKEVSVYTSLNLGRPTYLSKEHGPLLGQGIISFDGPIWAHQKKIIAPEFYLDKVKVNVKLALVCFGTFITLVISSSQNAKEKEELTI